jgi:hypothetical protein
MKGYHSKANMKAHFYAMKNTSIWTAARIAGWRQWVQQKLILPTNPLESQTHLGDESRQSGKPIGFLLSHQNESPTTYRIINDSVCC